MHFVFACLAGRCCLALAQPFLTALWPAWTVTCAIKQRTGAAIHTGTSCFWDIGSDGVASVVWPKRKSGLDQTMTCIAHAFAVALSP